MKSKKINTEFLIVLKPQLEVYGAFLKILNKWNWKKFIQPISLFYFQDLS